MLVSSYMTPRSTRRLENQLRMEIVKTAIDWDMVLETIPQPGVTEEEDAKRRLLIRMSTKFRESFNNIWRPLLWTGPDLVFIKIAPKSA